MTGTPEFARTTKQVNKAGERIRRARGQGRELRDDDLQLLDEFRAAHYPTLREVQDRFSRLIYRGLKYPAALAPVTARPLKTREAIIAKLVREKTRLITMQDIAGTRVKVPLLEHQEQVVAAALEKFKHCDAQVTKDSREDGNRYGYRAVHLVVTMGGRFAEIQIRTAAQDSWAQIVEKLDEAMGSDLKHGNGPAEWLEWLQALSDALRNSDLGLPYEIPQTPLDQS